jgi:hypothetical protein
MAGIKPKFGDCTKCPKTETLLYRVKPPECKTCYQREKQKIYAERQKQRQKEQVVKPIKRTPLKHTTKRINQVSKTNKITTSTGEVMSRAEFDNRIRKAKAKKLQEALNKYGYIVCEDCKRNDCKPIDCSHDKSVKACIEDGVPELAYEVENITMRGRKCHNLHDKTY